MQSTLFFGEDPIRALNATEKRQVETFKQFCAEKPEGFCSVCMTLLYPNQVKYTKLHSSELVCISWNHEPIMNGDEYMVCDAHVASIINVSSSNVDDEEANARRRVNEQSELDKLKAKYVYPGNSEPSCEGLNYRELSVLSPLKLMSQITRKKTLGRGRIGHYELSGSVWTTHNYDFAQTVYGGTLGLFLKNESNGGASINKERVRQVYQALQATHPLLSRYDLQPLVMSLVHYHVVNNKEHIGAPSGWENKILMTMEETNPEATEQEFNDLIIGKDIKGQDVPFGHPPLLALLFPHLFPACTGFYSMTSLVEPELPEHQGGIARATLAGMTLGQYAKSRLLMKDRRFAKDPSFIFFMLDAIEKHNIASFQRRVITTANRGDITVGDVTTVNDKGHREFNKSITSNIPYNIRSSYAYKRKAFLDMKAMLQNLGEPQLFLTFSCDDMAPEMVAATGCDQPWEDPVLFAQHFKRKWTEFFSIYVLKKWGPKIGHIKDYAYVMELQDRGSPHVHVILWSGDSIDELIRKQVISAKYPNNPANNDLADLVRNHQIHRCNPNYCSRVDPVTGFTKCRFGYPKEPSPTTYFDAADNCVYARDISDEYVNNYNPYLLSLFRTNMDIQYNKGPRAGYYLTKYLNKMDDVIDARVEKANAGGIYVKSDDIDKTSHFKGRVVGAVEAVYDICGYHKHQSSREIITLNTNPPDNDRRILKDTVLTDDPDSKDIFPMGKLDKYEGRQDTTGLTDNLTFPDFFCFYIEIYGHKKKTVLDQLAEGVSDIVSRPFHTSELPLFVKSCNKYVFKLREDKQAFWRTFNFSEKDGESFYYQQVVTKVPFVGKVDDLKGVRTWGDVFEDFVRDGTIVLNDRTNISTLNDLSDSERGPITTANELRFLMGQANSCQQATFMQAVEKLTSSSVVFVSGAAGTGKSFLLKMFERYYRLKGFKTFKLAPTGVAANNINGQTIHRFFGMSNSNEIVNMNRLDEYVKTFKRIFLLIDEYSMIPLPLLQKMNSALIKSTGRPNPMGGIKTIFFGDFAQLSPVLKNMDHAQKDKFMLWNSPIYNHSPRFSLTQPVRQTDPDFLKILNLVRVGTFNKEVIKFINSHTVYASQLPINSLRLYSTLQETNAANKFAFGQFPGEIITISSKDYFVGNEQFAIKCLDIETHLLKSLHLKIGMPVMLIQNVNVNLGWVNGTVATVTTVENNNICLTKTVEGETSNYWIQPVRRTVPRTNYTRSQFPLVPAFACTIHKAQSATIDSVAIHLGDLFEHGQLYVAMSRVRKARNLFFFGSELPLKIKRSYTYNWNANEIVLLSEKRARHN